jgi:hypothetical protein
MGKDVGEYSKRSAKDHIKGSPNRLYAVKYTTIFIFLTQTIRLQSMNTLIIIRNFAFSLKILRFSFSALILLYQVQNDNFRSGPLIGIAILTKFTAWVKTLLLYWNIMIELFVSWTISPGFPDPDPDLTKSVVSLKKKLFCFNCLGSLFMKYYPTWIYKVLLSSKKK